MTIFTYTCFPVYHYSFAVLQCKMCSNLTWWYTAFIVLGKKKHFSLSNDTRFCQKWGFHLSIYWVHALSRRRCCHRIPEILACHILRRISLQRGSYSLVDCRIVKFNASTNYFRLSHFNNDRFYFLSNHGTFSVPTHSKNDYWRHAVYLLPALLRSSSLQSVLCTDNRKSFSPLPYGKNLILKKAWSRFT